MISKIEEFYKDQSVFITGATGFLGKVLVEKLLRSCGEVKNIYVLLRSKKGKDVKTRLNEMMKTKIFEKFEPFVINKVVAIEGDITLPGLGISEGDLSRLVTDVSIVFHSAANIRFDEPLKTAINYNVLGTRRIIELCHKLPKLMALLHVSTAFSNCNMKIIEEKVYPSVPPQKIIDLCETEDNSMVDTITPQLLEGFHNIYTFTKGLAESLLIEECAGIPVAIIRPSLITASWKDPIPGWIDISAGLTTFMAALGKGVLRQLAYEPDSTVDLIPVDTVVNLMIAIVWFTATHRTNGIQVFNCTSGALNPTFYKEVFARTQLASVEYPSSKIYRYPSISSTKYLLIYKILILFNHLIPAYLSDGMTHLLGDKGVMVNAYNKLHRAFNFASWYCFNEFICTNNNVLMLGQQLTPKDRETFGFDIRSINWSKYWTDYYLGIRQYIFKESNETLPEARRNLRKIYIRDNIIALLLIIFFICIMYLIQA